MTRRSTADPLWCRLRRHVAVATLGLVVLSGACESGGGSGQPTPETTTGTVTPDSTRARTPSRASTSDALGDPVDTSPGRVLVAPLMDVFELGRAVQATAGNGTAEVIYVEDLHAGCSIAVLEQRRGDRWVALPDCGAERAAAVLAIGPGRGRSIRIEPESLIDSGSPLVSGTYRLVVGWRTAPGPEGFTARRSYSSPFQIQD